MNVVFLVFFNLKPLWNGRRFWSLSFYTPFCAENPTCLVYVFCAIKYSPTEKFSLSILHFIFIIKFLGGLWSSQKNGEINWNSSLESCSVHLNSKGDWKSFNHKKLKEVAIFVSTSSQLCKFFTYIHFCQFNYIYLSVPFF